MPVWFDFFPRPRNENADNPSVTRFSKRNAYLNVLIPQESKMHWKKRQKQIQYLQAKHGNDRSLAREFPDLKVEQRTAPCSNGMRGRTADLQWMGGKKP